jgi:hypothetical protein
MNKKFWEELIAHFPLIRHGQQRKRRVQQFFYFWVCVRCRGNVSTMPFPSNNRRTRIDTQEGFMKYAVEIGSCAMICIPSFIKIISTIQKLIRGDTQTHRQHGDRVSLLSLFRDKESRLNTKSIGINQCPEILRSWCQRSSTHLLINVLLAT